MLRNTFRTLRAFGLCAFAVLLFTVPALAADASYLIRSHSNASSSIFAVSKALDQGSAGILLVQEDNQSYGLPVYRAEPNCTVTVEGSAAQLRVFPVDLYGGEGSVRWTEELSPNIGQMRVTLSEGVQTISASEFKSYTSRLVGTYTHEVGAGFRLANAGYYLVSHSDGMNTSPSSIIVHVENGSTAGSVSAAPSASSLDAALFGPSAAQASSQSTEAVQNSAPVLVNGKKVIFDAYTISEGINGYTYFKLRDLAAALSGTEKQYEVGWDKVTETILLVSGQPYTLTGGELAAGTPGTQTATLSRSLIYKDGVPVSLSAYVIGKNNYFKLRDIGQLFNFSVSWDNDAMCIVIDTSKEYTP